MSIIFSSDFHLGCNRYSHTTASSRKELKKALKEAAGSSVDMAFPVHTTVCGGDFFDTFSNSEDDLIDGLLVYHKFDLCLAGNHDLSNDATKSSSVQLMAAAARSGRLVRAKVGEAEFHVERTDDADLYLIPHHSSQLEFEKAMQDAMEAVIKNKDRLLPRETTNILVMHCNYNLSDQFANETALNLTQDDTEILLDEFDYVLLGHEHTPASYFGGRLLVIGNTHPTSFADVSDKRVLAFSADGGMRSVPTWDASAGYAEVSWKDLEEFSERHPDSLRFIKVTGKVLPAEVKEVSRLIRKAWKDFPQAYMIGNFTSIMREIATVESALPDDELSSLPERIDKALRDTPLHALWTRIYNAIQEANNDN